jgi:diaminopimelate decarboxylase
LRFAKQFEDLNFVDLGGGLPVSYGHEEDFWFHLPTWGKRLGERMEKFCEEYGKRVELQLEPGRFLVAVSGYLVAEIESLRKTSSYTFAVLNTGANHNLLPSAFGKCFPISFISRSGCPTEGRHLYVLAGCLCSAGDIFTVDEQKRLAPREFPQLQIGDLMIMEKVGAYCYTMMNNFNSLARPLALLLEEEGGVRVIERRETFADIVNREQ